MRLARFWDRDGLRVGLVDGEEVVDITEGAGGQTDLTARSGVEVASLAAEPRAVRHPLGELRLAPPVSPRKFFGVGLNYADDVAEAGIELPPFPCSSTSSRRA